MGPQISRRQFGLAAVIACANLHMPPRSVLAQPPASKDPNKEKVDALVKRLGSGLEEGFMPALKGKVREVTTLDPTGPGSFEDACRNDSIVVFKVSGVIDLGGKELRIKRDNLLILGAQAPAAPIVFKNGTVRFEGQKISVDNIHFCCGNEGVPYKKGEEPSAVKIAGKGTAEIEFKNCTFSGGVHANVLIDWSPEKGAGGAPSGILFERCAFTHPLSNAGHNKKEALFKQGHGVGLWADDYVQRVEVRRCFFNSAQFGIVLSANTSALVSECAFQNVTLAPIFVWPVPNEYKDNISACKGAEVAVDRSVYVVDPNRREMPNALVAGYLDPKQAARVPSTVHVHASGPTSGNLPPVGANIEFKKLGAAMTPADALKFAKELHAEVGANPSSRDSLTEGVFKAAGRAFLKPPANKPGKDELDFGKLVDSIKELGGYPAVKAQDVNPGALPAGEAARRAEIDKLRRSVRP